MRSAVTITACSCTNTSTVAMHPANPALSGWCDWVPSNITDQVQIQTGTHRPGAGCRWAHESAAAHGQQARVLSSLLYDSRGLWNVACLIHYKGVIDPSMRSTERAKLVWPNNMPNRFSLFSMSDVLCSLVVRHLTGSGTGADLDPAAGPGTGPWRSLCAGVRPIPPRTPVGLCTAPAGSSDRALQPSPPSGTPHPPA